MSVTARPGTITWSCGNRHFGLPQWSMADAPKSSEKAERAARLQAALRENLKRRKAQMRGRALGKSEPAREAHDSAGIDAEKD